MSEWMNSSSNKDHARAALERKRDQAYEMAGFAAQDGDRADCARQTAIAKECEQLLKELNL
jgi:hypothetical protein